MCAMAIASYVFARVYFARPGDRLSKGQKASFLIGIGAFYLGTSWPVHDIAEKYLYSAHMIQHVLLMLVTPPALLLAIPPWMADKLFQGPLLWLVRRAARPVMATLVFNSVVALSHWPLVVDWMSRWPLFHEVAHLIMILAALVMWLPVLSPTVSVRRLSPPAQMLYLFVQSVLPTVPASFFTFATGPLVPYYAQAPRFYGISLLADQQLAGFVMKVVGGLVIWGWISVIFFRWYANEGAQEGWSPRGQASGREPGDGPGGGGPEQPEPPSSGGETESSTFDFERIAGELPAIEHEAVLAGKK
jgi:putative membrane protein